MPIQTEVHYYKKQERSSFSSDVTKITEWLSCSKKREVIKINSIVLRNDLFYNTLLSHLNKRLNLEISVEITLFHHTDRKRLDEISKAVKTFIISPNQTQHWQALIEQLPSSVLSKSDWYWGNPLQSRAYLGKIEFHRFLSWLNSTPLKALPKISAPDSFRAIQKKEVRKKTRTTPLQWFKNEWSGLKEEYQLKKELYQSQKSDLHFFSRIYWTMNSNIQFLYGVYFKKIFIYSFLYHYIFGQFLYRFLYGFLLKQILIGHIYYRLIYAYILAPTSGFLNSLKDFPEEWESLSFLQRLNKKTVFILRKWAWLGLKIMRLR